MFCAAGSLTVDSGTVSRPEQEAESHRAAAEQAAREAGDHHVRTERVDPDR